MFRLLLPNNIFFLWTINTIYFTNIYVFFVYGLKYKRLSRLSCFESRISHFISFLSSLFLRLILTDGIWCPYSIDNAYYFYVDFIIWKIKEVTLTILIGIGQALMRTHSPYLKLAADVQVHTHERHQTQELWAASYCTLYSVCTM